MTQQLSDSAAQWLSYYVTQILTNLEILLLTNRFSGSAAQWLSSSVAQQLSGSAAQWLSNSVAQQLHSSVTQLSDSAQYFSILLDNICISMTQ